MKLLLILSALLLSLNISAQKDSIKIKYFRKEKAFGIINTQTKQILVQPKYYDIQPFYLDSFSTKLFAVTKIYKSDNTTESYLINAKGKRISNFSAHHIKNNKGYFSYSNNLRNNRGYFIDTNCTCIPKDYFPCPNRVPMDLSNATETQKNIQKLEWVFEFKNMDSAVTLVDNFIRKFPKEPSYYFYKAWLLKHGYSTQSFRLESYYFTSYYDNNEIKHFKEFPAYIWSPIKKYDSTQISQIFTLEKSIDSLNFNWEIKNEFYEILPDDSITNVHILYLLDKVLELEVENKQILFATYEWKFDILNYPLHGEKQSKKEILTKIKSFKKEDFYNFPSVQGLIVSAFYKYSKSPSYGFKIGLGISEKRRALMYSYFAKYQFGYEKFALDNQLQAFSFSMEMLISGLAVVNGNNYYKKENGKTIKNLSATPLNLSFITKKNGYTTFSYAPELGFHFWNFAFNVGYNFVRKEKFPKLRGPFASANMTFFLFKDKYYSYQEASNLFE